MCVVGGRQVHLSDPRSCAAPEGEISRCGGGGEAEGRRLRVTVRVGLAGKEKSGEEEERVSGGECVVCVL